MWFSIVCILIDNGKLADQIVKLVAIVVKIYKNLFYLLYRKEWAHLLCSLKGPGYAKANPITPYIHIMLCHLTGLLQEMGSVKSFTGQGMYIIV